MMRGGKGVTQTVGLVPIGPVDQCTYASKKKRKKKIIL